MTNGTLAQRRGSALEMAREGAVFAVYPSHVSVRTDSPVLVGELAVLLASEGGERRGVVFRVEGPVAELRCFEGAAGVSVGDAVLFAGPPQAPEAEKFVIGGFYGPWGEELLPSRQRDRTEDLQSGAPERLDTRTEGSEPDGALIATRIRAVDALFPLSRGGRFAVAGDPGTGKTTLLRRVLCGALDPRLSSGGRRVAVWAFCGARPSDVLSFTALLPDFAADRTVTFIHTADQGLEEAENLLRNAAAVACDCRERGLDVLFFVDALPQEGITRLSRLCAVNGSEGDGAVTVLAAACFEDAARYDGLWALDPFLAVWGCHPALDRRLSFVCAPAEERASFLSQADRDFIVAALDQRATPRDGALPTDLDRWERLFALLMEGVFLRQNAFETDDSSFASLEAPLRVLKELDAMGRRFLEKGGRFSELAPLTAATELTDLGWGLDAAERGRAWLAAFSEGLAELEDARDAEPPLPSDAKGEEE